MHAIYLRPRQILCLVTLPMLWAAAGLWLVLAALPPQGDAGEKAVHIGTVALALMAPPGLFMAWLARAMGSGPLPAQAAACSERMQAIGQLSGPFAHELNNQLGTVRNSAHLILRIDDARLALPVQALLRAVEAAGALTQRLQRYGDRERARPQPLDVNPWLPGLQPALALWLGPRMALDIGVASQAMQAHVDCEGLELALGCLMLGVREVLADGAVVRVTAGLLDEVAAEGAASGRQVQVCVEAWACSSWLPEPSAPREEPLPAVAAGDGREPLALARSLCRSLGCEVWMRSEPGRCVVAALVLPVQDASVPPSA